MGHALGLALQGRLNDPVSLALIIVRFAPATGSDLPDLPDALLVHPLAPQLHGGSAHPASGTTIVTDRVSPARVRHLPQVAPWRNLPAGLGRPRGLRRGSAYGSFPAVHQPRRNLSLWRGILLFAASLSRFGF